MRHAPLPTVRGPNPISGRYRPFSLSKFTRQGIIFIDDSMEFASSKREYRQAGALRAARYDADVSGPESRPVNRLPARSRARATKNACFPTSGNDASGSGARAGFGEKAFPSERTPERERNNVDDSCRWFFVFGLHPLQLTDRAKVLTKGKRHSSDQGNRAYPVCGPDELAVAAHRQNMHYRSKPMEALVRIIRRRMAVRMRTNQRAAKRMLYPASIVNNGQRKTVAMTGPPLRNMLSPW